MKKLLIVTILVIGLALGGCSDMSDTEKRTLGGAGIGAAAGGAVGAIAGDTPLGIAVWDAAGAVGGYLYDRHEKSKEKAYEKGQNKDGQHAGDHVDILRWNHFGQIGLERFSKFEQKPGSEETRSFLSLNPQFKDRILI